MENIYLYILGDILELLNISREIHGEYIFIYLYISGDILELLNISREMHGEYTCNADNGVSLQPAWQSININVLCK